MDVIDLFREPDTRDELGIGHVRDAFSDLLFPGTSTIQTRAGYFLFLPWIYLDLERLQVPSSDIADRARREEVRLINALAESADPDGTIGIEARASLKRLPSSVYWNGLRTWGILLFPGSRGQYHRSLDAFYRAGESRRSMDLDEDEPRGLRNWHAGLPRPPDQFPRTASFALRGIDAAYLQERILSRAPGTLLAHLVLGPRFEKVHLPWFLSHLNRLPDRVQSQLAHARNFSEVIEGAPFLYNLMLAQKAERPELEGDYRQKLEEWASAIVSRSHQLARWNRPEFWEIVNPRGVNIPHPTRRFVDRWLDLALIDPGPEGISKSKSARRLIEEREHHLKRGRARLTDRRALELWNGKAGIGRLDYRWSSVVQDVVLDILEGLDRRGGAHTA